jgi:glucosamine--fructose-6-phosphate aminotransferase (isomerizing)
LLLAISQSGRSEDLSEFSLMARAAGARTAAIVNDTDSPLAHVSEIVLPMAAGIETSVAATKSFIASLAVLLRLAAGWRDEQALAGAVERLPDRLAAATELDWSSALPALSRAESLVTIGRGPTLAIAREAALKLKETCNIHAEAFSGAEFQHGPVALVSPRYPIVLFMPSDEAGTGLRQLVLDLRAKTALVFATDEGGLVDGSLPALLPDYPDADAVCLIQSFYALAVRIAERRGTDIDRPRHLQKVIRTR